MIEYHVVKRCIPHREAPKYTGVIVPKCPENRDQLFERMSAESTVTEHDVKAVLSSLQANILGSLREGRSVRLGDLGSFHLVLHCDATDSPADFDNRRIRRAVLRFVPSVRLRRLLAVDHPLMQFSRTGAMPGENSDGTSLP